MKKHKTSPTIKDVAEYAGVSVKTVSRVINDSSEVKDSTRKKVLDAIEKLGYRPNALAKSLRMKRTYTIGVIISDIANSFFGNVMKGIENVAIKNQYNIIFANSDENIEKEKMYYQFFIEKQVEGMIIIPAPGSQSYLKKHAGLIPMVFVDRKPKDWDGIVVKVNNEEGAYLLTKHLIEVHGYRSIVFLATELDIDPVGERFEGYKKAMEEANLKVRVIEGNRTIEDGCEAIEKVLFSNKPQAIFGCNHVMTLGAIKATKKYSLEVPRDIAVVEFDDFESGDVLRPYLTAVAQDPYKMGEYAAELLFKQITKNEFIKEKEIIIPVELKFRESCGCLYVSNKVVS
ncbi:LacI family DNA-binding transcriptional regulator [Caldanaerobacter subterraneus]|uniref:LacI family DNA-binding transcriptional regulator n=1 Tax=Caldanaerobacter subterraneus TaxID=911092 RepID=UPI003464B050